MPPREADLLNAVSEDVILSLRDQPRAEPAVESLSIFRLPGNSRMLSIVVVKDRTVALLTRGTASFSATTRALVSHIAPK